MTKSETIKKLKKEYGIETDNVYPKTPYPWGPDGASHVGLYPRETWSDFYFYSEYDGVMLKLPKSKKKPWALENFGGMGEKYQIPLTDFVMILPIGKTATETKATSLYFEGATTEQLSRAEAISSINAYGGEPLSTYKPTPEEEDDFWNTMLNGNDNTETRPDADKGDDPVSPDPLFSMLSAREVYAILHSIPCSGTKWLDEFVRKNNPRHHSMWL